MKAVLFVAHEEKSKRRRNFYTGGRYLTDCEVTFLRETRYNILHPAENLNDLVYVFVFITHSLILTLILICRNNPRFPCPCTLRQAQIDGRLGRLASETAYETSQHVVCYAPMTSNWIRLRWTTKLLRPQVGSFIFRSVPQCTACCRPVVTIK